MKSISVNIKDKRLFNEAYLPFLTTDYDYEIYWGGGGSGKSQFIVQKYLIKCMQQPYFRLLYCRKVADTIRMSSFQLFKDVIFEWGLNDLFHVKESTMEIICANGNTMQARGLDDIEKVKSIAGITDVWVEEATECQQDDIDQLDLRVRSAKAKIQYIISFNPIDERHWIRTRYFSDEVEHNKHYVSTKTFEVLGKPETLTISYLHTTYQDNRFLPSKYIAKLEAMAFSNPNYHRVYKLGKWGKPDVQRPYIHNFSYDKHVSQIALYNPRMPNVHIAIDFNLEPFVCLMNHTWIDAQGMHKHWFDEIVIKNGDFEEMARRIQSKLTPQQLASALYTGDATGHNRRLDVRPNVSAWKQMQSLLNIPDARLKVRKANPSVADTRPLINLIFSLHPDMKFYKGMSLTINELQYTEADPEGGILKKDRNKMEQRADGLDCFTGDTMVLTDHGHKPIKDIRIGEYVLTRKGYRMVLDTWDSMAEVYEYAFSDGTKITCTAGHRYMDETLIYREIKQILSHNKSVWKLRQRPLPTTAGIIINTPISLITTLAEKGITIPGACTGRFGLITMVKYLKGFMCTIKTTTRQTMISAIWRSLTLPHTMHTIGTKESKTRQLWRGCKSLLRLAVSLPSHGTKARKAGHGTVSTRSKWGSEPWTTEQVNVIPVDVNIRKAITTAAFAPTYANQDGEGIQALTMLPSNAHYAGTTSLSTDSLRQDTALSDVLARHDSLQVISCRPMGMQRVYDITVAEEHEFYAHGILVHNCCRYELLTFHSDFERHLPMLQNVNRGK
jgi:hypothetical protein